MAVAGLGSMCNVAKQRADHHESGRSTAVLGECRRLANKLRRGRSGKSDSNNTQSDDLCREVPRLPRKRRRRPRRQLEPKRATRASAVSATPATQNARLCLQVPRLPHKQRRRPRLQTRPEDLQLSDPRAQLEHHYPAWSTTASAVTYLQQKLLCPHNHYWSPISPTIHHTRLLIFVRIIEDLPRPSHHPRKLRYVLHKKTMKKVYVTARSARCSPSLSRTRLYFPHRERSYHTKENMLQRSQTHLGLNMLHGASRCP